VCIYKDECSYIYKYKYLYLYYISNNKKYSVFLIKSRQIKLNFLYPLVVHGLRAPVCRKEKRFDGTVAGQLVATCEPLF
jgi:hypothetical protein